MIQFQYERPYHNLGWLFYRNMYDDRLRPQRDQCRLDFSFLKAHSDEAKAQQKKDLEPDNAAAFQSLCKEIVESVYPEPSYPYPLYGQSFAMTTTYPGLLLGSGYAHETGVMGEFKLGFYFDATSGLPLVPGSTVKGVLRSAFPNVGNPAIQDKAAKAYGLWKALSAINADEFHAREWSQEYWSADPAPAEVQFIHALEQAIFDGVDVHATQAKKEAGPEYLSIYKRDIFHDAVIVSAADKGAFLGMDFITPHLNRRHPELNAFTAPIPIQFLKLLPGVRLQFHFQLKDFHWGDWNLSAAQKVDLFQAILLSQGIGAKTNVGYGQFEQPIVVEIPTSDKRVGANVRQQSGTEGTKVQLLGSQTSRRELPKPIDFDKLKGNGREEVIARLLAINGKTVTLELVFSDKKLVVTASNPNLGSECLGNAYIIRVTGIQGRGANRVPNVRMESVVPIEQ